MSTDLDQKWSHLWTQDWRNQSLDSPLKVQSPENSSITLWGKTKDVTNGTPISFSRGPPSNRRPFDSLHFNAFCGRTGTPADQQYRYLSCEHKGCMICAIDSISQFLHLQNRDKNHLLGEEMEEFYFGQTKFEGTGKEFKAQALQSSYLKIRKWRVRGVWWPKGSQLF